LNPKNKNLQILAKELNKFGGFFDLENRLILIEEKDKITQQEDFWNNPDEAKKVLQELAGLKEWVDEWNKISKTLR